MFLKHGGFLTVQKLGGNAMLVDAEHAFDPAYSKALGVDVENLIVCQPDNGEMALESNPKTFLLLIWLFSCVSYLTCCFLHSCRPYVSFGCG